MERILNSTQTRNPSSGSTWSAQCYYSRAESRAAAELRLLLLLPTLGEKLQAALGMTHLQYTPRTAVPPKTDTVLR
ncbi:Uncharacterized protein DAT39_000093 [Clarias magur]|uniref:Uncharacterized protein n=1 Tax=Clarias magur TaxID=1594786 RepID=A0A8J4XH04_CLAMG|nr:Uncharacterized protein DAT39_000093 [Clarias magur]